MSRSSLLQRFLALDRHTVWSLAWRLLAVILLFRPWAWRFQPVAIRIEDLDPDLLALAQSEGLNVLDRTLYMTQLGLAARLAAFAVLLTLGWWATCRLHRRLARRRGPGFLSTLAAVLPLLLWVAGLITLGLPRILDYQGGFMVPGQVPVWGGWVRHPLLTGFTMAPWLLLLGLGFILVELILQALEGRMLLAEAREGALRARLAPHFLYNAFNTLGAQIRRDPEGAEETTQRLSSLFEQVTAASSRPSLPLRDELALVEELLSLERRRLGPRLQVGIDAPEELLVRLVPVLSLQVLVENALKHAIAPRPEGGILTITVRPWGRGLEVAVTDSGDGQSRAANGTGQALANLRERLRHPSHLSLDTVPEGFRAAFRWVSA